ncbi:THO complex subunit 7 homolog [Onthophagus taurus]|uniref:THO complex subunit 7 homolog n=1 Tax=Onthophagus taurus TaxID=166361 RepID=UPI000C20556D|nr:THO complex subunit 7 homolog [Onthophagus taurus]
MSDEEVIRRRLLIDGDGTGDDRRLNALLKAVIKFANSSDDSETENQIIFDRMLSQIAQCEFAMRRSLLLQKTNQRELENYKIIQSVLEEKILKVKKAIEEIKIELEQAKILKQNMMMYDLLAQSIQEQPARKDTDKRLMELKAELGELREEKRLLEQKLDMRRKQFHVLISSCNQLQSMSEDKSDDDHMNTSLDDITNSPGPEVMSE